VGDPPGTRYYELPLAIQDRSFNRDGSLFYPPSRRFSGGFAGPHMVRAPEAAAPGDAVRSGR
jgi:bilirubin oxidase